MRPPCEIVQREFLPALRTQLAKALQSRGFSQNDIASRLDVTQAAVSKYLNQEVIISDLSFEISELVQRLTDMVANPEMQSDVVVKELCSSCMQSRIGAVLCKMHQETVPSLKKTNCQICSRLLGGRDDDIAERANVIGDMQDAMRVLESSSTFEKIVPQVRANLVSCTLDAKSIKDVAGVPGRITIISGYPVAPVGPQFGASRHTAEILVNARSIWPNVRTCLCISGRDDVVRAAKRIGFRVTSLVESESDAIKIFSSLKSLRKQTSKAARFPGVHVPGGFSIESILYLFGPSATLLAEKCLNVSDMVAQ